MDGELPTKIKFTTNKLTKQMTIDVMFTAARDMCNELQIEGGAKLAEILETHRRFEHENLNETLCESDANLIPPVIATIST